MEDLNAQQIVLLTLLVSFVTSIATGITTVSLLEKAPEPVTQTVNRVVERTVERVVEVDEETDEPVERIVETVIVKEEDLTVEAVAKNSRSLVRIYEQIGDLRNFIGLGIVVTDTGDIVADALKISKNSDYVGVYQAGEFELDVNFREANNPFAQLSVVENASSTVFSPGIFADSQNIKLAQSVIALSGRSGNVVTTGIVTDIETITGSVTDDESSPDLPVQSEITLIDTSVNSSKVLNGSILLNLQGEIVGAKINGDPARVTAFIPSNQIVNFLSSGVVTASE